MCTPPHFPSCLITVSATPSVTTVPVLQYGISLRGISNEEDLIQKIYIVRSLGNNLFTYNYFIIILIIYIFSCCFKTICEWNRKY